ncbi:MAG: hypothetical protein LBN43_00445 [Oscillospiraceae bacterium]|jgi:hypothetical protein|nr:hypothetical protein [Oscillospiraceae bacterium]
MSWNIVGLVISTIAGTLIGYAVGNHFFPASVNGKPSPRAALCGLAVGVFAAAVYTAPDWIALLRA